MKTEFIITGHIPSKKNSRQWVKRGLRMVSIPSKAHGVWEEEHLPQLQQFPQLQPPYQISIVFYAGTKHRNDLTNKVEAINDLLVKAGVLQDDNWFDLTEVALKFGGVDRTNPRAEVLIVSADAVEVAA